MLVLMQIKIQNKQKIVKYSQRSFTICIVQRKVCQNQCQSQFQRQPNYSKYFHIQAIKSYNNYTSYELNNQSNNQMNSKYLSLIKIKEEIVPDSVQKYIHSSLTPFSQQSLLFFGYVKAQETVQPKKKFTFKVSKEQNIVQKANFYNFVTNQWTKENIKGKIPPIRQNYLTINFSNQILLFGGKNSSNKLLNDIHALSKDTLTWKKLFSIEGPSISDNNILVGLTQTKIMLINHEIWTFELKNVKWQLNLNELPGGIWQNKGISLSNLKYTKLLNAILINQQLLIFFMEQTKLKCCLLDFDHKQIRQVTISQNIVRQNVVISQIIKIKNKFLFLLNQQIILLQFICEKDSYKVKIQDKLDFQINLQANNKQFQCLYLTQNHLYYIFDRKIFDYQLKVKQAQVKQQKKKEITINKIEKKQEYSLKNSKNISKINISQSIAQQSNQSSLFQQKQRDSQQILTKDKINNKALINSNSQELLQNSQIFRDSNLQQSQNQQFNYQQQNNLFVDQEAIKSKMEPLLGYQHLKRVKLEQKGKLLQKQIKQSQKFVLALLHYSQQRQKTKHINKIKDLRQQLEGLWNKEIFFRKQIQSQDKKIQMDKILRKLK